MGTTKQDQHTNSWETNSLNTPPILGGLKKTYPMPAKPLPPPSFGFSATKRLQYTTIDQTTRPNPDSKLTSQADTNTGVTSQTITSGPLIHRRVIIHVEDHNPKSQQTGYQTYKLLRTPQKTLSTFRHGNNQNPQESAPTHHLHDYHPSIEQNVLLENITKKNLQTTISLPLTSTAVTLEHKGQCDQTIWFVSPAYLRDPSTITDNRNRE